MNCILMRCLVFATFAAGMMAVPVATHAEDAPANAVQAGGSGHGSKHVAQHVISSRDVARISYPQAETTGIAAKDDKEPDLTLRTRSLLLTRPSRFDREGVYIWRDAEGIWQIQAVSNAELAVTGRLIAEKAIVPEPNNGAAAPGIVIEGSNPSIAVVAVTGVFTDKATPVQFKAEGAYVNFDLQTDGKSDLSRIFLGSRGLNPAAIPFRLENRPVEIPEPEALALAEDGSVSVPGPAKTNGKTGPGGESQGMRRGGSSGGSSGGSGGRNGIETNSRE